MGTTGDGDAAAVAALEGCWERLWAARPADSISDFDSLMAKWEPMRALDPVALETDLLSPSGDERYEPAHTQVLAYLLDPRSGHQLGSGPLHRFLDAVFVAAERDEPALATALAEISEELDEATADESVVVEVVAERAAHLDTEEGEQRRKTDLWIEVPAGRPQLLVVVENKIDDVARAGQLAAYDAAIQKRVAQLVTAPLVAKVYLTPFGDKPSAVAGGVGWLALDYGTLAMAWLTLLKDGDSGSSQFLRLYLATVFQKLIGLAYRPGLSRVRRADVAAYVRQRLEEQA